MRAHLLGRRVGACRPRSLRSLPLLGAFLGFLVALAVVLTGPSASANASLESAYGFDRTWNCALRMVRVDMNFKITEKDEKSGYLLFDYKSPESSKPTPGSIEIVKSQDGTGPVRVVAQLPQMPRYHEQALLDSLAKKLRQEYGEPPALQKKAAAPDAGVEAGEP